MASLNSAETFRRLHPRAYMSRLIEQGCRSDGRAAMEPRPAELALGTITTADGSALATVGRTSVVCGIRALTEVPRPDAPDVGRLQITLSLTGLCGDKYQHVRTTGTNAPISNEACAVVENLKRLVDTAGFIQLADLCILAGRAVCVLSCDLICLDDDGNVLDACVLALVGALKDVRLPAFLILEDAVVRDRTAGQAVKRLALGYTPVPLTCGIFENSLLADTTAEEESVMDGFVTVLVNPVNGEAVLWKPGGPALKFAQLKRIVEACKARHVRF